MAKSIPELSLDTQTLQRILEQTKIGDTVPYETLSKAIGRDVQAAARGNLRSARRRLLKLNHMVFGAIPNVGVKRLTDEGKIAAAKGHFNRGRNQFRQARVTATSVDNFAGLPNALKVEHNIIVAQSGALLHMTASKPTRVLAEALGDTRRQFTPKESLELMGATIASKAR